MASSQTTKTELIAEIKKLRQEIKSFKKKSSPTFFPNTKPPFLLMNAKWDLFYKNAANIIIILNKKGEILDINKVKKGINKNNIVGKCAYDFVAKESRQQMKHAINSVLKTKKPKEYNTWRVDKKNNYQYYTSKASAIIENKKVVAVMIDAREITDEIITKNQLKQSEEKFKKLSDSAFEGIAIHQKGKVVEINKAISKIFEYPEKQIIGKSIFKFIDKSFHQTAIEKLQNKDEKSYEMLMLKKGNNSFWAELSAREIEYNGEKARVVAIRDINQQKEYELEIIRNRRNYKSLIDYSPDGVIIHIAGKIKFANPSALKIIGVDSFEELDNVSALEYILPEHHQQLLNRHNKTKAGEELDFIEITIKNKKGEIKELETKPILIKYNGKEAVQIIFHDLSASKQLYKERIRSQIAEEANKKLQLEIIERKNAEKDLKQSEEKYRDLFENSSDLIQSVNIDGEINYVNNAWKKTLKYTDADLIGKSIFDFVPPENLNHCALLFRDIINGENEKNIEVVFVTSEGQKIVCEGNVSCKYENGIVSSTRGVFRDVTERNRVEKKLKEQSAKLFAIFESSSHIIWTIDKNMCLTSFNKNFEKHMISKYNCEIPIGLSLVSGKIISTPEYNEFWIKKNESAFKGERHYFECELKDSNGNTIWQEFFLNPIYSEDGTIHEISGIGNDITEKKIAEEKIRQSLQEKNILLKEVHHRVKNNLQVISSILNLQSSYVKDPQTLTILKESQNRIKSMAFIHESLYQTKDLSSINFSEYVTSLMHNLIYSYSNLDHEIKLTLDIRLVFLNLDLAIPCGLIINEIVSNTLKYAFVDNQADAEITIKMYPEGNNLKLTIGDNGIGLPKHINFRNTESLGLQLVVTLTDQLNGTIDIDTTKGTIYTIAFKQNQK